METFKFGVSKFNNSKVGRVEYKTKSLNRVKIYLLQFVCIIRPRLLVLKLQLSGVLAL